MHCTEEARKIWVVEVSTFEYSHYSEELMHLLSVTLNLIRRFTQRQVPRGGVYGGLVILAHPGLMVRDVLYIRTLQRLVIHLVARVLNRGFWFSKITRIAQNTTSITNRLKLLTPKVQTLL